MPTLIIDDCHDDRGERLELPMPVVMILILRLARDTDEDEGNDVGEESEIELIASAIIALLCPTIPTKSFSSTRRALEALPRSVTRRIFFVRSG